MAFGDGDVRGQREFFFFFLLILNLTFAFYFFLSTFHQKNNKPLIYKGKIVAKMIDTTNSLSPGHWNKIMSVSYSSLDTRKRPERRWFVCFSGVVGLCQLVGSTPLAVPSAGHFGPSGGQWECALLTPRRTLHHWSESGL